MTFSSSYTFHDRQSAGGSGPEKFVLSGSLLRRGTISAFGDLHRLYDAFSIFLIRTTVIYL